jgi:hypothetical protein
MLNFNRVGFSQKEERSLKKHWGRRWLSLTVMPLVAGGLLGMTIPRGQALAGNPYQTCAEEMLEIGISSDVAANVCAGALQPKSLSRCVSKIYDNVIEGVDPSFILFNCQRVRRPKELATCVGDILDEIPETNSEIVIESCSRSLLPERYASCAIGLYQELQLPSTEIFASCLNPEDLDN